MEVSIFEVVDTDYTRSPLLTWLSRRAQSGRRSSFVKRVRFTESHTVFVIYLFFVVVLFTQFILDVKDRSVSSETTKPYFVKITQSLHSLADIALVGD